MDNTIALIMFIGSIAALGVMAYAYRYKNEPCGLTLILASGSIALGAFCRALALIIESAPEPLSRLSDAVLLTPWFLLLYALNRARIIKSIPNAAPALIAVCFTAAGASGVFSWPPAFYGYLALTALCACACAVLALIYTYKNERYLIGPAALLALLLVATIITGWAYYGGALRVNLVYFTLLAAMFVILNQFIHRIINVMAGLNRAVVESIADAVIVLDRSGVIVDANPAARRLLGKDAAQRYSHASTALKGWPNVSVNTQVENHETFSLIADGAERHFDLHRTPVFDPGNAFLGQILVAQETTDLKRAERMLEHASTHDELTGLPNRFLFQERLQKELYINERLEQYIAVTQINIDNLQSINDTLSIYAGDQLILGLAKRLQEKLRRVDTLTRFSGDEFLIIMPQVRDPKLHISGLINRLFETVSEPFYINDKQVRATFSMGVTIAPSDGTTVEELLSNANMALAFSKATGKNRYSFYDMQMSHHTRERWRLANDLRAAIEGEQFTLYYQPQVKLGDGAPQCGAVVGVEALLRWEHPERGLIHPETFIPVAEEFNLIGDMGEWALRAAARQLAAFIDMGYDDLKMSVNISVKQLYDPGLAPLVGRVLEEYDVPAAGIELEITESIALSENPALLDNIRRVRDSGVHFVMDDFGMGHSSLVYLRNFPLNKLKLDKSLSLGALEDTRTGAVVHSIAVLCDNLNIDMVVEFVEDKEHLELLMGLGCRVFQGYLFSKPLSAGELPELLEYYRTAGAHGTAPTI